jgi:hypothetical protein
VGAEQFNAYPEQLHAAWQPANRSELPDTKLPSNWRGFNPRSRRAEHKYFTTALTDTKIQEVLDTATSREDFHDYDLIHNHEKFPQGCLCELRFISGQECAQKHLVKGPDGKTMPTGNDHWAWYIDIAPRGYLCPSARERHLASIGGPPDRAGCPILLSNKPPPKEWVLAQDPGDVVGTLAGRAVTDEYPPGLCPRCRGEDVDKETNELHADQSEKFVYKGPCKPTQQPMEYRPSKYEQYVHPLLARSTHHHKKELMQFPGVDAKEVWIERRKYSKIVDGKLVEKRGCTLKDWNEALGAALDAADQGQVLEPHADGRMWIDLNDDENDGLLD